ncbi:MAG: hypothetical protein IPN01_22055 [Deltaproteobacteria bacterium]|nr:hypothetical protein [Deltaproteobacteria bacterium]
MSPGALGDLLAQVLFSAVDGAPGHGLVVAGEMFDGELVPVLVYPEVHRAAHPAFAQHLDDLDRLVDVREMKRGQLLPGGPPGVDLPLGLRGGAHGGAVVGGHRLQHVGEGHHLLERFGQLIRDDEAAAVLDLIDELPDLL